MDLRHQTLTPNHQLRGIHTFKRLQQSRETSQLRIFIVHFLNLQVYQSPSPFPKPSFFTAGSTHPAFSDVFLILPTYINQKTGLKIAAADVLRLTVHAVTLFLRGDLESVRRGAREVRGAGDRMVPGLFLYHDVLRGVNHDF